MLEGGGNPRGDYSILVLLVRPSGPFAGKRLKARIFWLGIGLIARDQNSQKTSYESDLSYTQLLTSNNIDCILYVDYFTCISKVFRIL